MLKWREKIKIWARVSMCDVWYGCNRCDCVCMSFY